MSPPFRWPREEGADEEETEEEPGLIGLEEEEEE